MAELLKISLDSAESSAADRRQIPRMVGGSETIPAEDTWIRHFVSARQFLSLENSPASGVVEFAAATRPVGFSSNIGVGNEGVVAVMNCFKHTLQFTVSDPTQRPEFRQQTFQDLLVAQGPPRDSWTTCWVLVGATHGAFSREIEDVKSLIAGIRRLLPLDRSPQIRMLARQAIQSRQGPARDVAAWADRLSRDVVDAND